MGRFSNVDPNFQQEQNRFLILQALRTAKNTGPVSPKKALALIIPVFIAAAALLLLFSGAFGEKTCVRYQEHLYQLMKRAMRTDFSWAASARKYMELYRNLLGIPEPAPAPVRRRTRTTKKKEAPKE